MKQGIVLSAVLISGLILAGCQSGSKQATDNNAAKTSAEAVKTSLGQVAGQNYTGMHKGDGKATDPTYVYKISFSKDGRFGQEIISKDGYAARFIQQGTYKYSQAKKQVTLKINKVTETSYKSDDDLSNSEAPIRLSVRSTDESNSVKKLTVAEKKPLVLEDKGSYLLGTVNNVKLIKDGQPVGDFNKLAQKENNAYSSKAQVINQKTFFAKLGTSRIWMTFNGDGTWQCRIIDGTHRWDIYDQGTWKVNSGQLVLETTDEIHEYTIVGSTANPTQYSNVTTNSSRVTDNFTWKIKGQNLVITSNQDSKLAANMTIKANEAAQVYTAAQDETSGNTEKNVFGSQETFYKWLKRSYGTDNITIEDADPNQVAIYTNVFYDDFYGHKVIYICDINNKVTGKVIPVIYSSDGKLYEMIGDHWTVAKTKSEINGSGRNESASRPEKKTSQSVVISNKDDFGEWIDEITESKDNDNFKLYTSNITSKDYYKNEFTSEVSGVMPLYYAGESGAGGRVQSTAAEWIYGDDGKVYSHFTGNGPSWHIDKNLTAKLQSGQR